MNFDSSFSLHGQHLDLVGASYAGNPKPKTVMFVSKKVEGLLTNLVSVEGCLVFIESDVCIPPEVDNHNNLFVRTENPQWDYTEFVISLAKQKEERDSLRKFHLTEGGYYVGENVSIGANPHIEPGVLIGHDVVIGDNATILAGAKIKHATIGHGFIAGENCSIGTQGFNFAKDLNGSLIRIPSLGAVVIGDDVEVGALSNVTCGLAGDTVLKNYAKIDVLVHVGHDVVIGEDVEIPAGVILGGFSEVGDSAFIGVNSSVRNRIRIGHHAYVGMGAAVTKDIMARSLSMGVPAMQKGWMCSCGGRLDEDRVCKKCGRSYHCNKSGIQENEE